MKKGFCCLVCVLVISILEVGVVSGRPIPPTGEGVEGAIPSGVGWRSHPGWQPKPCPPNKKPCPPHKGFSNPIHVFAEHTLGLAWWNVHEFFTLGVGDNPFEYYGPFDNVNMGLYGGDLKRTQNKLYNFGTGVAILATGIAAWKYAPIIALNIINNQDPTYAGPGIVGWLKNWGAHLATYLWGLPCGGKPCQNPTPSDLRRAAAEHRAALRERGLRTPQLINRDKIIELDAEEAVLWEKVGWYLNKIGCIELMEDPSPVWKIQNLKYDAVRMFNIPPNVGFDMPMPMPFHYLQKYPWAQQQPLPPYNPCWLEGN